MTTRRDALLDKVAAREIVNHGEDPTSPGDIYRFAVDEYGRLSVVHRGMDGSIYGLNC